MKPDRSGSVRHSAGSCLLPYVKKDPPRRDKDKDKDKDKESSFSEEKEAKRLLSVLLGGLRRGMAL
jgi:hypothetical protein